MAVKEQVERLGALYARMDMAYGELARGHGLSCEGCADNCCAQRFHHHTLAEYLYLMEGVRGLGPERRDVILRRANVAVESYFHEAHAGEMFKLMCPVNFEGLCALYRWRPMICRLHGLPHFFTMPDGSVREGAGCARAAGGEKGLLDRTPFYRELADIEKAVRAELGRRERFRKTTAEMLVEMSFEPDAWED
jgi:Fe-S-cluster containining protein